MSISDLLYDAVEAINERQTDSPAFTDERQVVLTKVVTLMHTSRRAFDYLELDRSGSDTTSKKYRTLINQLMNVLTALDISQVEALEAQLSKFDIDIKV